MVKIIDLGGGHVTQCLQGLLGVIDAAGLSVPSKPLRATPAEERNTESVS